MVKELGLSFKKVPSDPMTQVAWVQSPLLPKFFTKTIIQNLSFNYRFSRNFVQHMKDQLQTQCTFVFMYVLLYPSHTRATIAYFDTFDKAYKYCETYIKPLNLVPEYSYNTCKDTLKMFAVSPVGNYVLADKGLQVMMFDQSLQYIQRTYGVHDAILFT